MTKVDFYHLQKQTLEDILPRLLEKALESGKKAKVKIGNEERVEFINLLLWTYKDFSFLPHGSKKDGNADRQPVWLSSGEDNPNDAEFLFLVDGARASDGELEKFARVFNIFDGNEENALNQARDFWKRLKDGSFELSYWQQENGRWTAK
jgi:DNA polymerase-3 subunit chi